MKSNSETEKQLGRQRRYLPKKIILEETQRLPLMMFIIGLNVSLVLAFIIWASLTKIDEAAVTYGQIVPATNIGSVQHLEGGIISKILVENLDGVEAGQNLLIMDPTKAQSELEVMQSREISLLLDIERLKSYILNKEPDPRVWGEVIIQSKYNNINDMSQIDRMLEEELSFINIQRKTLKDQGAVLQAGIQKKEEELTQVKEQQKNVQENTKLLLQEKQMYDSFGEHGPVPQRDYLEVQREINKSRGDLTRLLSQEQQFGDALLEAKSKLNELRSRTYREAMEKIDTKRSELEQVRHSIEKLQDQVRRLHVTAPIAGTIQGLKLNIGGVVQPGELIMSVVPKNVKLLVQTRIQPRDVGHIKIGDGVKIKINSYDYSRYGSIDGILIGVSATTFLDNNNNPYYEGSISLDQEYIEFQDYKLPIISGMTVQADIITDEKSLLAYLLKPIHVLATTSFQER